MTPPATKPKTKRKKTNRTAQYILLSGIMLVLVILLIFTVMKFRKDPGFFDPNAKDGPLPGRTQEEIQAELNRIVEEGMFNISIASVVVMEQSSRKAPVKIENIAANHHNMTVTITLDENNEIVYESAGLAPGQYIEYADFNRKLAAGEYKATALFTAYDIEDLSVAGRAAAKITIMVTR
ncbi:MAG: hypothetical protein GX061_07065 [Eubacteriaceae bacterium]|nr:hypothetical protein [Eubacteriaceae bacterium]